MISKKKMCVFVIPRVVLFQIERVDEELETETYFRGGRVNGAIATPYLGGSFFNQYSRTIRFTFLFALHDLIFKLK